MKVFNDDNAIHELTHGYEGIYSNDVRFQHDGGAGFWGMSDKESEEVNARFEVNGYRAQYAFSKGGMPGMCLKIYGHIVYMLVFCLRQTPTLSLNIRMF